MVSKKVARIIGLGSYLPKRRLKNSDLETLVETTDEWILSRTGISERRISADGEYTSDMGAQAAIKALDSAHLTPAEVCLIIMATMTPDYTSSSTAAIVQAKIGATKPRLWTSRPLARGLFMHYLWLKHMWNQGCTPEFSSSPSEKCRHSSIILTDLHASSLAMEPPQLLSLRKALACRQSDLAGIRWLSRRSGYDSCRGHTPASNSRDRRREVSIISAWMAVRSSSMLSGG